MAVDDSLVEKVHALSDLELAILLCLISREHCLMSTPTDAVDDLIQELQLVCPLVEHQPFTNVVMLGSNQDLWPQLCSHRLHPLHDPRGLCLCSPNRPNPQRQPLQLSSPLAAIRLLL